MSSLDKARDTQLQNILAKTNTTLDEIRAIIAESGLEKHSELRQMFRSRFGLGYGDADQLVHFARQSDGQSAAEASGASLDELTAAIYGGAKQPLLPLHQQLMAAITAFGEFEIAPKKTYLSLRRKRQFAMLGPGTRGRLEVGINCKELPGSERLLAQAPGGMCQFKVFLTRPEEIDDELLGWLRRAYDSAG